MYKDSKQKIVWDYQKAIIEVYKEQDLKSLAGLNQEFVVNGQQMLTRFYQVTRKGRIKFKEVDFPKLFDDIVFCSDEILYFTAHLYLYTPYINNPLQEGYWVNDTMIFPDEQNLEAKRLSMFINTLSEKIYNYWDRMGDLIATYFPNKIDSKKVYFSTAIDIIPEVYHKSSNYDWLRNFKENEYKVLNEKRKDVVHYIGYDTNFRHKHISSATNEQELAALIEERNSLPNFYKSHIETTLNGFEKTLSLIEEITEKELKGIE